MKKNTGTPNKRHAARSRASAMQAFAVVVRFFLQPQCFFCCAALIAVGLLWLDNVFCCALTSMEFALIWKLPVVNRALEPQTEFSLHPRAST